MPLVLFFSPRLVRFAIHFSSKRTWNSNWIRARFQFKHSYFDGLRSQWSQLYFSAALRKWKLKISHIYWVHDFQYRYVKLRKCFHAQNFVHQRSRWLIEAKCHHEVWKVNFTGSIGWKLKATGQHVWFVNSTLSSSPILRFHCNHFSTMKISCYGKNFVRRPTTCFRCKHSLRI